MEGINVARKAMSGAVAASDHLGLETRIFGGV
jgi:hypothetical protein